MEWYEIRIRMTLFKVLVEINYGFSHHSMFFNHKVHKVGMKLKKEIRPNNQNYNTCLPYEYVVNFVVISGYQI